MQTTDIITFTPDVFRAISIDAYLMISEGNIERVFDLLRKHKYLTITDIVDHFEKAKNPKSESSIYRYLQKLLEKDIAIKAGKRIYLNQDITVRSEPIYCLTARAFIQDVKNIMNKNWKRYNELINYSCELLSKLYPNKKLNVSKVTKIMKNYLSKHLDNIKKLELEKSEEKKEFLDGLNFEEIIFLHDSLWWFSLLLDDGFIKEFYDTIK